MYYPCSANKGVDQLRGYRAFVFAYASSGKHVREMYTPLYNTIIYMGHYQKMEQSLSLMVFSQARCPRFAFSMYNISFRGALLEPHAISRFRVRYLQKRDARSAILSIFTVSLGQGK